MRPFRITIIARLLKRSVIIHMNMWRMTTVMGIIMTATGICHILCTLLILVRSSPRLNCN